MAAPTTVDDEGFLGLSSLGSIFGPGIASTSSTSERNLQASSNSSNTSKRLRRSQQSFIRNFLLNIATLPYYRIFRRNTLAPILRILESKNDAQLLRRMRVWRDAKISELRFVQVAAAIVANGVIGCFSWSNVQDDFWLGKSCWYIGMLMAVAAVLLSSQQHVILEMGRLTQEDGDGQGSGSLIESEARAARRFLTLIAVHKDKISPTPWMATATTQRAQQEEGEEGESPASRSRPQGHGALQRDQDWDPEKGVAVSDLDGIANASGISFHHDEHRENGSRLPASQSSLASRSTSSAATTINITTASHHPPSTTTPTHHHHHTHHHKPTIAEEFSPNWNMVYIWQSPMMLLTYSWICLLMGLTIHVCNPLIAGIRSGGEFNSAILFLVMGSLSLLNFFWCSFWVYRYPMDDA